MPWMLASAAEKTIVHRCGADQNVGHVQVLVGLVNRDNMMVIIRRALAQGHRSSLPPEIEYEDLNKNFVSAAARHLISEQQLAVLQVTRSHPRPAN